MERSSLATLAFAPLVIGSNALRRLFQREPEFVAEAPPQPPRRITSPRRAGRPEVKVWVLHACPQCDLTHSLLHHHRYPTEQAPSLPGMGCDLVACECRYEPVRDTRRGERRRTADRRDLIRFKSGPDRRRHPDRRESDGWRHAGLR